MTWEWFKEKLTSRKFWLALLGAAVLFVEQQYEAGAAVIIAYLAAEGIIDIKNNK